MKIYIVVFEEYAHGSKILEDSKERNEKIK